MARACTAAGLCRGLVYLHLLLDGLSRAGVLEQEAHRLIRARRYSTTIERAQALAGRCVAAELPYSNFASGPVLSPCVSFLMP